MKTERYNGVWVEDGVVVWVGLGVRGRGMGGAKTWRRNAMIGFASKI